MRSLLFKDITIPVAFKAIPYSRRAQLWNRQASKDVLDALGQYRIESNESDRQTATKLGVNCLTLKDWLRGVDPPQRCLLARLAGFLRRVGYL